MTLQDQSFDKRLAELKAQMQNLNAEVQAVEKQREEYIKNIGKRKDVLLQNSIALDEANVEVHDGVFFLVFKDDSFEYVARLTKDQAEHFADELDDALTKAEDTSTMDRMIMNNILKSIYAPGTK